MPTASAEPQGLPFRPASFEDFSAYVRTLRMVLDVPLQHCQTLLAQIYGYSGLHELKAILKTPGAAGPFEEDMYLVARGYEVSPRRRARAAKILERDSRVSFKAQLSLGSFEELVFQLGLFERPSNHKQTAKLIAEAVALVMTQGWAFSSALKLVKCFTPRVKYDMARLSEFEFADTLFDPLRQSESVRTYREPYLYLRDLKQNVDLEVLAKAGWPGFASLDNVHPHSRFSEWTGDWSFHFWEELCPEFADEPDDEAAQEADDFIKDPNPKAAARNFYLKQFPYITELAQNFDAIARTSFANELIEQQQRRLVLEESFQLPEDLNIAESGQSVICSVHLGESTTVDQFDDLVFWDYHATFCIEDAAGAWVPLALMKGILIEPYRGKYRVSEHNFQWEMDAHSAMLNDVWKVLTFEFFSQARYRNLSGYLRERPGTSFAVVHVEIHPAYRGKGLLPWLMNGFLSVFDGQPFSNLDHGWSSSGLERAESWYDLEEDVSERDATIQIYPPAVLIFPVAGARPERNTVRPENFLLIGSPAKVRNRKVDKEVEARRAKLESHFLSLRGQLYLESLGDETVDVLVYDPWSYPIT